MIDFIKLFINRRLLHFCYISLTQLVSLPLDKLWLLRVLTLWNEARGAGAKFCLTSLSRHRKQRFLCITWPRQLRKGLELTITGTLVPPLSGTLLLDVLERPNVEVSRVPSFFSCWSYPLDSLFLEPKLKLFNITNKIASLRTNSHSQSLAKLRGCVCYIFASLFFKSKLEHL